MGIMLEGGILVVKGPASTGAGKEDGGERATQFVATSWRVISTRDPVGHSTFNPSPQ